MLVYVRIFIVCVSLPGTTYCDIDVQPRIDSRGADNESARARTPASHPGCRRKGSRKVVQPLTAIIRAMRNAMTFDVEDYFHVGAFADRVNKSDWEKYPSRVEANTERSIALLEDAGYKGTFFVLGWVAEHFSHLVRRIAAGGH